MNNANIETWHNRPYNGWSWSCDSLGIYDFCSPEVQKILGYGPADFQSQIVFSFLLSRDSSERLQDAAHDGDFPLELDVEYTNAQGNRVPAWMHIFSIPQEGEEPPGWYGFTLVFSNATSRSSFPDIDKAVWLIRGGGFLEARILLRNLVIHCPEDELAWLWYAYSFQNDAERLSVLENYVRSIPDKNAPVKLTSYLRRRLLEQSQTDQQEEELAPEPTPTPQAESKKEGKEDIKALIWSIILVVLAVVAGVFWTLMR